MSTFKQSVMESVEFLRSQIPEVAPDVGFLTGTGLSDTLKDMDVIKALPYDDIPHFPVSTVASHKGELAYGRLGGKPSWCSRDASTFTRGIPRPRRAFPSACSRNSGPPA